MKIEEIMVGDYLKITEPDKYAGFIGRVQNIGGPSKYLTMYLEPYNNVDVFIEDVEGIPLTAEILEKNGIKLEEVGDNGVSTPAKWRNRFEKWVLRTQWKDTFIWYDRTAKYWHLHDMGAAKLLYVHELQHALRLCGIEKKIEL